jgi:hypothetical protein
MNEDTLNEIWDGDLLGRKSEADLVQKFLESENLAYLNTGREASVVLAIDAAYGEGKSWFLDRLAAQLAITHPVARIDAWADDASEEPLTAFMSAIDEALDPYLSRSTRLGDKLAKAKIAALPIMGRLVKGVMVKGLSKVAGDSAEEAIGEAFEGAVAQARDKKDQDTGAIASAVEGAFEEVGKEIDTIVDRRGAAMLAEYRQRRKSRASFRQNMNDLVAAIDASETDGSTPLIVIIDELDRCRPDYAIRVLEEIKHFFDVPGVAFILAVHGEQLTASVEAVYGQKFDAKSYMHRFFGRTYRMRRLSVSEIVSQYMQNWDDKPSFLVLDLLEGSSSKIPSVDGYLAKLLDEYHVTPRETYPILDALRLFSFDTGDSEMIQLHALVPHLVRLVRGLPENAELQASGKMKLSSIELRSPSTRVRKAVTVAELNKRFSVYGMQLGRARVQDYTRDAAENLALDIAKSEFSRRVDQSNVDVKSVIYSYPERVSGIMRLSRDLMPLESVPGE